MLYNRNCVREKTHFKNIYNPNQNNTLRIILYRPVFAKTDKHIKCIDLQSMSHVLSA